MNTCDASLKSPSFVEINQQEKTWKRTMWRGMVIASEFIYETPSYVAGLVIVGIALRILFPFITAPILGMTVSILVTRLVAKTAKLYNFAWLDKVKYEASKLSVKYPYIQIIGFIFATTLSIFSATLGLISSTAVGMYCGVLIEINVIKKKQTMKQSYKVDHYLPELAKLIEG